MANFTIIAEKEAPPIPRTISGSKQQSIDTINQLSKGTVARITPDEGETAKGLAFSLRFAAKSLQKKLDIWQVDDVVYAKLAK